MAKRQFKAESKRLLDLPLQCHFALIQYTHRSRTPSPAAVGRLISFSIIVLAKYRSDNHFPVEFTNWSFIYSGRCGIF